MPRRTWLIIGLAAVAFAAAFLLPAMPQPPAYHDFADTRTLLGVANFLDVTSNAAFLVVGLAGMVASFRPRTRLATGAERVLYAVFFAGMVLTAAGSAYYHLDPDNETLFWDRLPMTISFMALVAAQVSERISLRAGVSGHTLKHLAAALAGYLVLRMIALRSPVTSAPTERRSWPGSTAVPEP